MGRYSTHYKLFLMTFQKVVTIVLKHFLSTFRKKFKSDFSGFHFETNRMVVRNPLKSEKNSYFTLFWLHKKISNSCPKQHFYILTRTVVDIKILYISSRFS